jgi:hypothetical protein
MKRKMWLIAGALGLCPVAAFAETVDTTPTINVGENIVLPNTSGQHVSLSVQGGMAVDSETLDVQIDQGHGPVLSGIDIITGSIFQSNNTGQHLLQQDSHAVQVATTVNQFGDSVAALGHLATLTLDTTGVQPGIYTLDVGGTKFGSTTFTTPTPPTETTVNPHLTNGHVIVTYPGDANMNGTVDFGDLLILAQNYGRNAENFSGGDFNHDGNVGFDDLLILAQNYGKTVQAVPVPMAVFGGLGLIGLIGCVRYHRSRKQLA